MMRLAVLPFMVAMPLAAQQTLVPAPGLLIERSARLQPGTYALAAADTATPQIVVRGNDVTVDMTGVTLVGAPLAADPDAARGIAILVDGGRNVTIRGARVRGYKIAIMALGTHGLRLVDNDLSHNWKPRMFSIVEHESIADWLSFHQNEKGEWLRFGAGIYLDGVTSGYLRGNTVRQGMNGLMMTSTDSMLIVNNDFSFNSGLGIGMYRSDHNRILHNRVDYNVRGYSEGFYRRGQDSAGILMYQQCDSNVVAYNSVTHGGDGLFVWAGQHTMDTGAGGVNDNIFYGNDFSWAPTNGMEATFSRNAFLFNRIFGSDHGMWGGYSYESVILGNHFEGNRVGIAIEHGQDNRIIANQFIGDSTAIYLWANPIEPSDWGYPKHRDTRSRDYDIDFNTIARARVAFRVSQTHNLRSRENVASADTLVVSRDSIPPAVDTTFAFIDPVLSQYLSRYTVRELPGATAVLPSVYANEPRSTIIVDEWGPYDWQSPKLWPVDSSLSTPLRLRVLGPKGAGTWQLVRLDGASMNRTRGNVGDTIVVTPHAGRVEDWNLELVYRGQRTVSPRGVPRRAGDNYRFSYARFDPRARWDVRVHAWSDSTHPLNAPDAFRALLRGERGAPVLSRTESRLDYVWYRPRIPGWPTDKYGVVAETRVDLPAGNYTLRTISDDGIRVYIDDRLVIEDWSVHESRVRETPIASGAHTIRIEYFQGDGWAELRAEIMKSPAR